MTNSSITAAESVGSGAPAAAAFRWEVLDKPITVHLSLDVIDRMEREVLESFKAVTKRGSEIGGLLLGRTTQSAKRTIAIEQYVGIECDYSRGPLYLLAEADKQRLSEAIGRHKTPGQELSVVGFFRSNTRKDVALDEDDLALAQEYFADPANVFLLVKPFAMKPSVAGFFFWEDGRIHGEASYLQFPFRRSELLKVSPDSILGLAEKPSGPVVMPIREERPPAPPPMSRPAPAPPPAAQREERPPVTAAPPKAQEPAAAPAKHPEPPPKPEERLAPPPLSFKREEPSAAPAKRPEPPPKPDERPAAPPLSFKREERPAVTPIALKREERAPGPVPVPKREERPAVTLRREERPAVVPVTARREERPVQPPTPLKREEPPAAKPAPAAPAPMPAPAAAASAPAPAKEPVVKPAPVKTESAPPAPIIKPDESLDTLAPTPSLFARLANNRWVWVGVLGVLLLTAGFFQYRAMRPSGAGKAADAGLGLTIERNTGQFLLKWNRSHPLIAAAQRATLAITDGDHKEDVDMDLGQLRIGSIVYSPITSDVSFRLEVTDLKHGKSLSESVRWLAGRPSPSVPMPGTPTPTPPPVQAAPQTTPPAKPAATPEKPAATATPPPKPVEQPPAAPLTPEPPKQTSAPAVTLQPAKPQTLAARLSAPPQVLQPPELESSANPLAGSRSVVPTPTPSAPPPEAPKPTPPVNVAPAPQPSKPVAQPPVQPSKPPAQAARVGGNVQEASVVRRISPVYPALARQARVSGVVRVEATIGKDGRVRKTSSISGPPLLRQAAADAVSRWLFKPSMLNNEPVEATTQVDVIFNLNR